MIPLKLTIKGLFSYQSTQTIDFNPLLSAQVFGVFGGVGSGKSSILDAITYALYGELDRLGKQDGRSYNMMNLRSNDLLIDFEFKTGADEKRFRYTVKGKRNSKHFDKVNTHERAAYKWEGEEWLPIDPKDTAHIIGISYQNFRRTVIIPQGRFQEFLQLGAKDRSQMLKEIFNLQKYDLYNKTAQLDKANMFKISNCEGRFKQFEHVNEGIKKERVDVLSNVEKQLTELQQTSKIKEGEIHKLKINKQLFDQKKTVKHNLDQLLQQEAGFKQLEQDIQQLEYSMIHFKPLLDQEMKTSESLSAIQISLVNTNNEILAQQKQVNTKKDSFIINKKIVDQKLVIHQEIEEWKKIIQINGFQNDIVKADVRLDKGQKMLEQIEESLGRSTKEASTLKDDLKKIKEDKPNYKALAKIDLWYSTYAILQKRQEELQSNLQKEQREIEEIEVGFKENDVIQSFKEVVDFDQKDQSVTFAALEAISLKNERQVKVLKDREIQLETHRKLETLSDQLHDGSSCPLCGSMEHPNKLEKGSTSKAFKQLDNEVLQLEIKEMKLSSATQLFQQINFQLSEKQKSILQIQTQIKEKEEEIKSHLVHFVWDKYDANDPRKFKLFYEKAILLEQEIETKEKELERLLQKQQDFEKKKSTYKDGLSEIEQQRTKIYSSRSTLLEQVTLLDINAHLKKKDVEINTNIQKISDRLTMAEASYKELDQSITLLNTSISQLKGKEKQEEKQQKELALDLKQVAIKMEFSLLKSAMKDKHMIIELLKNSSSLELNKQELEKYNSNLGAIQKQYQLIEKQTENIDFDPLVLEQLVLKFGVLKQDIIEKLELIGRYKQELEELDQNLKQKVILEEELKALKIREANLSVMKKMFVANRFVDHISSVYLEQLCNAANVRFQNLTKQQLRLELTDKNDFKVIDYMNDGKERSVKTLSGGQTFQASLSLALALAESVQHQTKSNQNFFFLDEGFGTQDKESLRIVFEAIKSLRKENRVVGIISHLEALQNEIDVFVKVEKDDETGTFLTTSYE